MDLLPTIALRLWTIASLLDRMWLMEERLRQNGPYLAMRTIPMPTQGKSYSHACNTSIIMFFNIQPLLYVIVHMQIGHNVQKRKNSLFLQHHNSGTTMCPELIFGMGDLEG